jgi:hypothetical protein
MKHSNYIAYDNMLMMPNSLGQGHIWWSYAPFCTWILKRKLNIGYNFSNSQYYSMKLSNYIAYDNTPVMMPNSLGKDGLIINAPLCTCLFFLT